MPAPPRPPLLRRLPLAGRVALAWCAAAALPLAVLLFFVVDYGGLSGPPHQALLALAIVTAAAGLLLRRWPVASVALLLAGSPAAAVMLHRSDIPYWQFLPVGIAVCYIAATRPRRTSIAAAIAALGVLAGMAALQSLQEIAPPSVVALSLALAWISGTSLRQRREYAKTLRAQATIQAVMAERLQIARELYDIVAHSIGVIAIQAGVGSRVIDTQPAQARNALTAIEATSRETLAGLRGMLRALRRAEPGSATEPAPLGPAPGLADGDRLAASAADAGVQVDVHWQGDRRALPAEIELSAFRIIQESITNVVRHAGTQHCQVSVDYGTEELSIEIRDDGRGALLAGTGYGITGMRERAGLLHGQLTAGPRPDGGFGVSARLPVPAGAR